jgi:hypothetical protein
MSFLLGVIIGAVFSPILIKLGQWGFSKINNKVDNLNK